MKKLLYVCLDGLGDDPIPEFDGRTPLEAAPTPALDALAARGRTGVVVTVGEGIAPESDIAVFAILGYDPREEHPGRGVVEAVGTDMDFRDGDLAYRVNFATCRGAADRRPARRARPLVGGGAGPCRGGERATGPAGRDVHAGGDGRAPRRARDPRRRRTAVRGGDEHRSRLPQGWLARRGARDVRAGGRPLRTAGGRPTRAHHAAELTNAFVEGSAKILDASEVNAERRRRGTARRRT